MITIEKNIPMPASSKAPNQYPFSDMEIGESFLVPKGPPQSQIAALCHGAGKRFGKKFSTRKIDGAVRVWRTE